MGAKYNRQQIKAHIDQYFAECKRLRRNPVRRGLADRMKITTRTLWNYREKYPDIFEKMDKAAIVGIATKAVNSGKADRYEQCIKTLARHYNPYIRQVDITKELPEEFDMLTNGFQRYLVKVMLAMGAKLSVSPA